jgi:D-proline reductase (dithiol) PrdB
MVRVITTYPGRAAEEVVRQVGDDARARLCVAVPPAWAYRAAAMSRTVDPTHRTFVSYIDKSREYYAARGYANPYRWATFEDVPFTPLKRPLSQTVVTLITTAHQIPAEGETPSLHTVYSMPSQDPPARLSTEGLFWDREATHTEDLDSYFPVHRLQELAHEGRIGRLAPRLHGMPTEYSQRLTQERDAPELLHRCRQDGADATILVPL